MPNPSPELAWKSASITAGEPGATVWSRRASLALGSAAFLIMLPVTLFVSPLQELVADRYAASQFWTNSFMSVNMIGAILAAPLIAFLTDRVANRTRIIVAALVLDGVALGAMSLAPNLAVLLIIRAFEGVFHILALSALLAMAADAVVSAKRGRMMGVVGACMMLGTAAGTRLGGLLWRQWPGWSFEAAAGFALIAALFVASSVAPRAHGKARKTFRDALALVRTRRRLLVPYAYTFIDRFCVGVIISSFVLFLAARDVPPDERSRLLTMFLCPFALLIYPAGRLVDRIGFTFPLAFGSAGFGLLFACYGFVSIGWLPGVMVASGVLSALMFAPTLSLCADLSPRDQRGAAYAGFNAAGAFGFICGPLVAGGVCYALTPSLGETGAYQAAFVTAGATEIVCAALTLPWLLRLQRSRRGEKTASSLRLADSR